MTNNDIFTECNIIAPRRRGAECEWFAFCVNPATLERPHPILGTVPICERCNAKAGA